MIVNALEAQLAGEGYSIVEFLCACPTNWHMSPVEANAYIGEKVIPVYPLGEFVARRKKEAQNLAWKEIIFAGFGGQGVLTGGLIIAYMAANKGRNTVWMPAYGATMRGGKANCVVKFSENDEETIGSPIMEEADAIVVMNEPALQYLQFCKPGATIFANSLGIRRDYSFPRDSKVIFIDFLGLSRAVGNELGQSLVAVAAVLKECKIFDEEYAIETMCMFFSEKGKGKLNELNIKAMRAGFAAV